MKGLLCSFTAPNHPMRPSKIQVTGCKYKHTYVRVAMFATVRIPAPFFWGGGPKSISLSLFLNEKASFKGIFTLNGPVSIYESFSMQYLNARVTHVNITHILTYDLIKWYTVMIT